jgi:REP element-mobilizing transposase RayT
MTMGRRRRHFRPEGIYFITNRCAGERYLLRPDDESRRIFLGAMARYAEIHDVEVFAYVMMGNHFHLILRSRTLGISDFMRDFQRHVSYEIQEIRPNWNSKVFPNRYKSEEIADDGGLHDLIRYTVLNPVQAGLVRHPADWQEASSWHLHQNGGEIEKGFLDRSRLRELRRKASDGETVEPERAMRTYGIELTAPPALEGRSPESIAERLFSQVEKRCVHIKKRRSAEGKDRPLGFEEAASIEPTARPDDPADAPEPICHANHPAIRKAYEQEFWAIMDRYAAASQAWRDGEEDVDFPPGTYPPGRVQPEPNPAGDNPIARVAFPNRPS